MPELLAQYQPLQVRLSDLDRDGHLDITGVIPGGWGIQHFFGRGDGTFGLSAFDAIGSYATGFDVGDVNGDAYPDWVFGINDRLAIAFNDGRGGRRVAPTLLNCGDMPSTMAVGDVNGDGWNDVVCGSGKRVELLLNRGSAPWFPSPIMEIANTPGGPAPQFADMNGDGALDLVCTITNGSQLAVFPGGGPTYDRWVASETPSLREIAVLDLDGDGNRDVVGVGGDRICTWKGHGDATLGPRTEQALVTDGRMALGDVDGDGHTDVVVALQGGGVAMLPGTAAGDFGAPRISALDRNVTGVALADVDRDGRLDVVTRAVDACVLRGRGDGFFDKVECDGNFGYLGSGRPVVTDVDGDSLPDVLVLNERFPAIDLFRGFGGGHLAPPVPVVDLPAWPNDLVAADLDGDGHIDLAALNGDDDIVTIAYGDGRGTFQHGYALGVGMNPQFLTVADLDGDAVPDLATSWPLARLVNGAVRVEATIATGVGSIVRIPSRPYYPPGTPVTVTAAPDTGWEFGNWNDAWDTRNPVVVTPQRDTTLVAHFRDDGTHAVHVVTPNGGESFAAGQGMTVQWTSAGAFGEGVRADVLLARDGGTYETLAHDLVNTGSWTWTVSGTSPIVGGHAQPTARIRVVVHSVAAGSWWDDSDAGFTVGDVASAGSVVLTYPNGGESFTIGDLVTVRWTTLLLQPGGTSVDLFVRPDSSSDETAIAVGVPNTGALSWPVMGPASNHGVTARSTARMRIVVRDPFAGIARDTSDAGFSVFSWQADGVDDAVPVSAALVPLGASPATGPLRFRVDVPAPAAVKVAILDALGRRVDTLVDATLGPGRHVVAWSRREGVRPGVYFARCTVGGRTFVSRCVLLE